MNRDTCEHFTPNSLRCAECEITTLQSELAAAREEIASLVSLIKEYEFDAIPTRVRLWIERHESAHKGEEG